MAVFIDENVARQKYCFLLGSEHTLAPPPRQFFNGVAFSEKCEMSKYVEGCPHYVWGYLTFYEHTFNMR